MDILEAGWLLIIIFAAVLALLLCLTARQLILHIKAARRREENSELIHKMADEFAEAVFILKNDSFIYANQSLHELFGYTEEIMKRLRWQDLVSPKHVEMITDVRKRFREGKQEHFTGEIVGLKSNGSRQLLDITLYTLQPSGAGQQDFFCAGMVRRHSCRKVSEDEKQVPADGLPGQRELKRQLALEIADEDTLSITLILINIDRLDRANDTFGIEAGDRLLNAAAERLQACEQGRVYHYRGDEFAILLKNESRENAVQHMQQIFREFTVPLQLHEVSWYESATMGVSFYPDDADTASRLIECAKVAVHDAKQTNRGRYRIYHSGIEHALKKKLELEMDLRRAIKNGEFTLYYQPQIDLKTGTIIGTEALIRWIHPSRGVISPGVFVPLAEEIGLIQDIGAWVLRQACMQTKQWNERGYRFSVSVNLSPKQLFEDHLPELVQSVLEETGLDAWRLNLEITETANADLFIMSKRLGALKQLGVGISIDDFGTGYNSLNCLKMLPLDQLKIDRSFILRDHENRHNAALVRAIVTLADELGLQVVAEGIETKENVTFLMHTKCDLAQGFLFARPLTAENLMKQMTVIHEKISRTISLP